MSVYTTIPIPLSDDLRIKERKRRYAPLPGTNARVNQMDVDIPLQPRVDAPLPHNVKGPGDNLVNLVDDERYSRAVKKCVRSQEAIEAIRVRIERLNLDIQNKKRVRHGGTVVQKRKAFLKHAKAFPAGDGDFKFPFAFPQFVPTTLVQDVPPAPLIQSAVNMTNVLIQQVTIEPVSYPQPIVPGPVAFQQEQEKVVPESIAYQQVFPEPAIQPENAVQSVVHTHIVPQQALVHAEQVPTRAAKVDKDKFISRFLAKVAGKENQAVMDQAIRSRAFRRNDKPSARDAGPRGAPYKRSQRPRIYRHARGVESIAVSENMSVMFTPQSKGKVHPVNLAADQDKMVIYTTPKKEAQDAMVVDDSAADGRLPMSPSPSTNNFVPTQPQASLVDSAMSWVSGIPGAVFRAATSPIKAANLWSMRDVQVPMDIEDDAATEDDKMSQDGGLSPASSMHMVVEDPVDLGVTPAYPSQASQVPQTDEDSEVWYDAIEDMLADQGADLALTTLMRTPPRNVAAIRETVAGQGGVPPAPEKITRSASYTSLFGESPLPSYENIADVVAEDEEFFDLDDNTPDLDDDLFGASPIIPQVETPEHSLAVLEEVGEDRWARYTRCNLAPLPGAFDSDDYDF